jgi:hypothetical protein
MRWPREKELVVIYLREMGCPFGPSIVGRRENDLSDPLIKGTDFS